MQHQNRTKEFHRTSGQRKALFKTMLGSLVIHEKVETTEAKAKELKNRIDRVINIAKSSAEASKKLSARRQLMRYIPETAVKKIIGEFLKKFESRHSGYSRVIKLAPRKSDGARMAIIELITK